MLELKVFQSRSAKLIADRYAFFASHPDRPSKGSKPRPFFQALSALTGAGKTPILAQAATLIRAHLPAEPIILWMSKARSVVGQTTSNFSAGGKYSHLLEDFRVVSIGEITPQLISDATVPLIVLTTTGLFNNKDQSEGSLHIYRRDNDAFGEESPWERLISRVDGKVRRPLIIVYDEGHNLSVQQASILAELEPEAYLLASATLRLPPPFQKSVVHPVSLWVDETDDKSTFETLEAVNMQGEVEAGLFITTTVPSVAVVDAQLVKRALQFDGTTASMERSIDDLLDRKVLLEQEIGKIGFRPKSIYVCKTNIADDGFRDDPTLPFIKREAPPIRIWRYLVEQKGINPAEIAIYANLDFADGTKPDDVKLFSKGEKDFDEFTAGNFRHIIFNLALQEGWDDPECYLAYIDKSMGSSVQVEQVMGRVLRQYGASHYKSPLLNTAHFFIRVDRESIFSDTIRKVKEKLRAEGAPITILENFGAGGSGSEDQMPREGLIVQLHDIFVDSEAARAKIGELLDDFPIFQEGDANSLAGARMGSAMVPLIGATDEESEVVWQSGGHTNAVRLRWLIGTALRGRSVRALAISDLTSSKFDVRVQIHSKADKLVDKLADDSAAAFYSLSELVYESDRPFNFGLVRIGRKSIPFANSLYPAYSALNRLELPCAQALDAIGLPWHRNSPVGGFSIPLLSPGETSSFYPDFLVWKGDLVYCLDTKGSHLLSDAVARKLFDIKEGAQTRILTRFISEGKQSELRGKAMPGGYTVWKMKSGAPKPIFVESMIAAVAECLK